MMSLKKTFALVLTVAMLLVPAGASRAQPVEEEPQRPLQPPPVEERMRLLIDVGSHMTLEVLGDIEISLERPRSGGDIMEATSGLVLRTNTDTRLTWESTPIRDEETGRKLPLGIPELQPLTTRSGTLETFVDQPFGLMAVLVPQGASDRRAGKASELASVVAEVEKERVLQNAEEHLIGPGVHEFEIVVRCYWSKDGSWSDILAGRYTGSIVYTVEAAD